MGLLLKYILANRKLPAAEFRYFLDRLPARFGGLLSVGLVYQELRQERKRYRGF